jgi:hypothetical protein
VGVDRAIPLLLTRVDEFLIGYWVAMELLDPFLHICNCIFPFGINLVYEVNKRSGELSEEEIPERPSAEVF